MYDLPTQSQVLVLPLMSQEGIEKTEPFKIQSYLQAGKPIYGVLNGAGREIIEENGLGLCAEPSDVMDIADGFKKMMAFINERDADVKEAAKGLMETRLNKEMIVKRITENLKRLR